MTGVVSLTNQVPTFRDLTLYFPSPKSLYCPTTKTKDVYSIIHVIICAAKKKFAK